MRAEDRRDLVDKLERAVNKAAYARALEVGDLVIEYCFGGDLTAWRDRNPRKNVSYRKLADEPRLPMSKSCLQRDVGVYVALQTLPQPLVRDLSPTHVAAILPLEQPDRLRFLALAKEKNLTTRQLHRRVVKHREENYGEKRGRPATPLTTKRLAALEDAAKRVAAAADDVLETHLVASNPPARLRLVIQGLHRVADRLDALGVPKTQPRRAAPPTSARRTG